MKILIVALVVLTVVSPVVWWLLSIAVNSVLSGEPGYND